MRRQRCPPNVCAYLENHPRATAAELAAHFGVTRATAYQYRSWAIKAGVISSSYARITLEAITEELVNGQPTRLAARHLGVSVTALRSRLARHKVWLDDIRRGTVFTANEVGDILGYHHNSGSWLVRRLMLHGLIARKESDKGKGSPYRITAYDLADWLPKGVRLGLIDPDRIIDPDLQEHAKGRCDGYDLGTDRRA